MSDSDEIKIAAMGRIFGPIFLFFFTPVIAFILYDLLRKEIQMGNPLEVKYLIQFSVIVLIFFSFGIWLCNKGYGWFEWLSFSKKKKK